MAGKKHPKKFSESQKKFIIDEYLKGNTTTSVKRAFRLEFGQSKWLMKKPNSAFKAVFDSFKKGGQNSVGIGNEPKTPKRVPNQQTKDSVKKHFEENPTSSLREASRKIEVPKSTVHEVVKKQLKMKAYKYMPVQKLTYDHVCQRVDFCGFLDFMGEDFPQFMFVSDEKNFTLVQPPNRQNDRYWAIENPHEVSQIKDQSAQKIMAFVCLIDGRALPVVWFEKKKPSDKVSVTQVVYEKMLREKILCHFTDEELSQYWWQQDGAPAHAAAATITYLKSVFGDRIISRASRADQAKDIVN